MPVLAAEMGRWRDGGRTVFPWLASAAAPLWVMERGVCAWVALLARVTAGGVPLQRAPAIARRQLTRRAHRAMGGRARECQRNPMFSAGDRREHSVPAFREGDAGCPRCALVNRGTLPGGSGFFPIRLARTHIADADEIEESSAGQCP